jgi:uncharacterized protein (TIGR02145 family)
MLCKIAVQAISILILSSSFCFGAEGNLTWTLLLLKKDVCDADNLDLCTTEEACTDAGGFWWSNTCNNIPEGPYVISEGQIWMDRNLGASRVATGINDSEAYGDLYQWGRGTDGHEKRTSGTTSTLSNSVSPGHGNFITAPDSPNDWLSTPNATLWQGVSGTNNPCPAGFRLPTATEWQTELNSWGNDNSTDAFNSPLKLVTAGYRSDEGVLDFVGDNGSYWSATVSSGVESGKSDYLYFNSSSAFIGHYSRVTGHSVRCIRD